MGKFVFVLRKCANVLLSPTALAMQNSNFFAVVIPPDPVSGER